MGALKTALQMKCPRCRKGDIFPESKFWPSKEMFKMYDYCPVCRLKYEVEIGFFYGAMFFSNILNMLIFVIFTVVYYMFFDDKIDWRYYIGSYLVFTFLIIKFIYKFSRSLWLVAMVKYDPPK